MNLFKELSNCTGMNLDTRVIDVLSILQGIIRESPKGLVSLNFGLHACIHMGTEVDSKTTASPPTRQLINFQQSHLSYFMGQFSEIFYLCSRVTYPAQADRLYTFLLMEAETGTLHWMVINVPGSRLDSGSSISF